MIQRQLRCPNKNGYTVMVTLVMIAMRDLTLAVCTVKDC
jgi:hypothetical protein